MKTYFFIIMCVIPVFCNGMQSCIDSKKNDSAILTNFELRNDMPLAHLSSSTIWPNDRNDMKTIHLEDEDQDIANQAKQSKYAFAVKCKKFLSNEDIIYLVTQKYKDYNPINLPLKTEYVSDTVPQQVEAHKIFALLNVEIPEKRGKLYVKNYSRDCDSISIEFNDSQLRCLRRLKKSAFPNNLGPLMFGFAVQNARTTEILVQKIEITRDKPIYFSINYNPELRNDMMIAAAHFFIKKNDSGEYSVTDATIKDPNGKEVLTLWDYHAKKTYDAKSPFEIVVGKKRYLVTKNILINGNAPVVNLRMHMCTGNGGPAGTRPAVMQLHKCVIDMQNKTGIIFLSEKDTEGIHVCVSKALNEELSTCNISDYQSRPGRNYNFFVENRHVRVSNIEFKQQPETRSYAHIFAGTAMIATIFALWYKYKA